MKNFDELVRGRKPEEFQLGGQRFKLRATLHSRRFSRMMAFLEDVSGADATVDAIMAFMDKALIPEDRARFAALLDGGEDDNVDDDKEAVTFDQINAVINWAAEVYTKKTNTQGESSTPGSPSTQTAPNVVSFSAAKTQAS